MNRHRRLAQMMRKAAPSGIITDQLLWRYIFDDPPGDPVTDVSGNGYTGQPVDLVAGDWTTGRLSGGAIDFPDTPRKYINTTWQASTADLQQCTFVIWTKNLTTSSSRSFCTTGWYGASTTKLHIQYEPAAEPIMIARVGSMGIAASSGIATPNDWHCIAYRSDVNIGVEIFIDGVSASPVSSTGAADGLSSIFIVGGGQTNNSDGWGAIIDEARFYTRRLSDAELLAIANDAG